MVLEAHEERTGHEEVPGLVFDDLQGRTYGVGRGVDGSGNQTVSLAEHHKHGAEIAVVGELLASLFFGHALLGAQFAQLGDHRSEHFLVVLGLELRLSRDLRPSSSPRARMPSCPDDDQIDDVQRR